MSTELGLLIVTEGKVSHGDGAFGIGRMLRAFDRNSALTANFRVDCVQLVPDQPYDLRDALARGYDQVWFFGGSSPDRGDSEAPVRPLRSDEREALQAFMDGGGGVFATGDHAQVGAPLCASIPRVRYMRSWGIDTPLFKGSTPTKLQQARYDTLFASGMTNLPDTEEDAFGKPIWVKYRDISEPHPLFEVEQFGSAIHWLPDHMHEGECFALPPASADPTRLMQQDLDEMTLQFPKDERPEVVAWGVRRGFSNALGNVEAQPALYGVVGCYDGFKAGVGRVVVDSTFHHWTDGNTAKMLDSPVGTRLMRYPQNIARWLSPGINSPASRGEALRRLAQSPRVVALTAQESTPANGYYRDLGTAAEQAWREDGLSVGMLREMLTCEVGARGFDVDTHARTGRMVDAFVRGAKQ